MIYDFVILGSNKTGMLLNFYIIKNIEGIKTCIIDDDFKKWSNNECLFNQEIDNTWIFNYFNNDNFFDVSFNHVKCIFKKNIYKIPLQYSRINSKFVFNKIKAELNCVNGIVTELNEKKITLENGKIIYSKKIIDCRDNTYNSKAYQIYYGLKVLNKNHGITDAVFMDWSQKKNSYLYSFPINKDILYYKEICVISKNKKNIDYNILKNRLLSKIKFEKILKIDQKCIALYGDFTENYICKYGEKASMVHPFTGQMTGYMIKNIPSFVLSNFTKLYNNIDLEKSNDLLLKFNNNDLYNFFENTFRLDNNDIINMYLNRKNNNNIKIKYFWNSNKKVWLSYKFIKYILYYLFRFKNFLNFKSKQSYLLK